MVFGSFCSLKYYKRRKAILFVIITGDKNLKAKPNRKNLIQRPYLMYLNPRHSKYFILSKFCFLRVNARHSKRS